MAALIVLTDNRLFKLHAASAEVSVSSTSLPLALDDLFSVESMLTKNDECAA